MSIYYRIDIGTLSDILLIFRYIIATNVELSDFTESAPRETARDGPVAFLWCSYSLSNLIGDCCYRCNLCIALFNGDLLLPT
jgi:hypothetical protein